MDILEAQVVQTILATYREKWDALSWQKQRHFASRALLVDTHPFWLHALDQGVVLSEREILRMNSMSASDRIQYGETELDGGRYSLKPNDPYKLSVLTKQPELLYWSDYFVHLRYLKRYRDIDVSDLLVGVDVNLLVTLITSSDSLRNITTIAIELGNDLDLFFGLSIVNEQYVLFENVFADDLSEGLWWNYVYGLTHFVISASRHYQQLQGVVHRAADDLLDEYDRILLEMGLDATLETVLALRLSSNESLIDRSKVLARVYEHYDPELGRIAFGTSISDAEHINSMAVMALGRWACE